MWLQSCAEFRPGHIKHMDGAVMLCAAHDDFRPGDRGKGRGITDMIDVIVTDDDLPHRFNRQRACKQRLPVIMGGAVIDAAIDDDPSIALIKDKQIDMIEPEGQVKTQPEQVIGNTAHLPVVGGV